MNVTTIKQLEDLSKLGMQDNPSPAAIAARAEFLKTYLNGVPEAYTGYLPTTDNLALLQTAAEGIRAVYGDDYLQATGNILPAKDSLDLSKMSPTKMIEHGLRTEGPAGASAKTVSSKNEVSGLLSAMPGIGKASQSV